MEKIKIVSKEVLAIEIDYSEINRIGMRTETILSLCKLPRNGWLKITDDTKNGILRLYQEEVEVYHVMID